MLGAMAERIYEGVPAYRGYTMGPALLWRGWPSLPELLAARLPVVVVASYLDSGMIARLERSRLLGVVTDRGSMIDPSYEALRALERPGVVGARGIAAEARPGDLVAVDAALGTVVLRPGPELQARAAALKGRRAEPEPQGFEAVLERLVVPIRQAWLRRGRPIPFDLDEQRALYAMIWRICAGGLPGPEDDALLHRILHQS
ncbi:MAG: hypothetical protein KatS3mg102_0414 [Planctomycetota bacterium]|nr:MAG: hypothetical protein KatS3mg102_0414 [Planctomycetota bacterium]